MRSDRASSSLLPNVNRIIEAMSEAVLVIERSGMVVAANGPASLLFGFPDAFGMLRPLSEYGQFIQEWRIGQNPFCPEDLTRVFDGHTFALQESLLTTLSGAERVVQFSAIPVQDDAGQSSLIMFIASDRQADRRLVENDRELRQCKELAKRRVAVLQATINSMVDAVFVVDGISHTMMTNAAGRCLLEMGDCQRGAWLVNSLWPGGFWEQSEGTEATFEGALFARALAGESVSCEHNVFYDEIAKREMHLVASASPILEEGKIVGAVAVIRDSSTILELDRLKDEFTAVAAHELKTPVTIMKGYAQAMVKASSGLPLSLRRMAESIDRGADRINSIVDDILDISEMSTGNVRVRRSRIDLRELVSGVVTRTIASYPDREVRIVQIASAPVNGDRARLEQVLNVLIKNAIVYSPSEGKIDVALAVDGDEAIVTVTDQGVGIPKEKQVHMFERFYRAHSGTPHDFGGMGLGLSISKEIILQHGGKIWFRSGENEGSSFYFSLPLADKNL